MMPMTVIVINDCDQPIIAARMTLVLLLHCHDINTSFRYYHALILYFVLICAFPFLSSTFNYSCCMQMDLAGIATFPTTPAVQDAASSSSLLVPIHDDVVILLDKHTPLVGPLISLVIDYCVPPYLYAIPLPSSTATAHTTSIIAFDLSSSHHLVGDDGKHRTTSKVMGDQDEQFHDDDKDDGDDDDDDDRDQCGVYHWLPSLPISLDVIPRVEHLVSMGTCIYVHITTHHYPYPLMSYMACWNVITDEWLSCHRIRGGLQHHRDGIVCALPLLQQIVFIGGIMTDAYSVKQPDDSDLDQLPHIRDVRIYDIRTHDVHLLSHVMPYGDTDASRRCAIAMGTRVYHFSTVGHSYYDGTNRTWNSITGRVNYRSPERFPGNDWVNQHSQLILTCTIDN
jgi:hypothetical protein